METIVRSETKEVIISTDGPVTQIGEKINPTGRKKLAKALLKQPLSIKVDTILESDKIDEIDKKR